MADPKLTFEEVVQTAIDSTMLETHTALPGVVQSFDATTQLADVQVTIRRTLAGEPVNLPLLASVPVRFLRCGSFTITLPLVQGDHVLLIFSERSIDTWLTSGEISSPADVRRHSLSDAFAIPMMYPQTDVISDFDDTNLQIRKTDGSSSITITEGGEIHLNGDSDTIIAFTPMDTLWQYFAALYNGHVHPGVQTGTGSTAVTASQITAPYLDLSQTEVTSVKVP